MTKKHEQLATQAERGELTTKPGTFNRGDDAAHAEMQQLLMDATGADTPERAAEIAVGRPSLDRKGGSSPVVRGRVPSSVKERVSALAAAENRRESDIVRDAVTSYLDARSA